MMVYSTREKKTSIMQANSQTSIAVTALETGILALETIVQQGVRMGERREPSDIRHNPDTD